MSGISRPSLGHEAFALFSFIFHIVHFKRSLGIHLEAPDMLLSNVGDQPKVGWCLAALSVKLEGQDERERGDRETRPRQNSDYITQISFR